MPSSADLLVTGLDPDGDGFWTAVSDARIPLEKCVDCDTRFALPLPSCPTCGSEHLEVIVAGGSGELYSWVVVHYAYDEDLARQVPYVIGAIELDERARIFARIEGVEPSDLAAGTRLTATFPQDGSRPPIVFVPEKGAAS